MIIFLMTMAHVVVCIFLILTVLLQTGKGADLAAAFGGSSQTAFGARGATTFLAKMTTGAAIVFMVTSITLALLSSSPSTSVLEDQPGAQGQQAPTGPSTGQDATGLPMETAEPEDPNETPPPGETGDEGSGQDSQPGSGGL
jgi:preprotein translocase subunit SecG